jgi:hypothetical protein
VGNLQLTSERQSLAAEEPQGRDGWLYGFRRAGSFPGTGSSTPASASSSQRARSLSDCCLAEGDMVILSSEGKALAASVQRSALLCY